MSSKQRPPLKQKPAPTQAPKIGGCGWAIIAVVLVVIAAQIFPEASQNSSSEDTADLIAAAERAREWQTIEAPNERGDEITGAAPAGLPRTVATDAIREAGHKCASVAEALRITDGSIIAKCTSGQRYRIFNVRDVGTVAMSCEAVANLGIEGAC